MTADVIYYTDNALEPKLQEYCLGMLNDQVRAAPEVSLIVVSQRSLGMDDLPGVREITVGERTRCLRSMYEQILIGVAASTADIIILAEHDCLYPKCRFDYAHWVGSGDLLYNTYMYWISHRGFFGIRPGPRLSQLFGPRWAVEEGISGKLDICLAGERVRWSEPGVNDGLIYHVRQYPDPALDIRHGRNITGMRKASRYMDRVPYWGEFEPLRNKLGLLEEINNG